MSDSPKPTEEQQPPVTLSKEEIKMSAPLELGLEECIAMSLFLNKLWTLSQQADVSSDMKLQQRETFMYGLMLNKVSEHINSEVKRIKSNPSRAN